MCTFDVSVFCVNQAHSLARPATKTLVTWIHEGVINFFMYNMMTRVAGAGNQTDVDVHGVPPGTDASSALRSRGLEPHSLLPTASHGTGKRSVLCLSNLRLPAVKKAKLSHSGCSGLPGTLSSVDNSKTVREVDAASFSLPGTSRTVGPGAADVSPSRLPAATMGAEQQAGDLPGPQLHLLRSGDLCGQSETPRSQPATGSESEYEGLSDLSSDFTFDLSHSVPAYGFGKFVNVLNKLKHLLETFELGCINFCLRSGGSGGSLGSQGSSSSGMTCFCGDCVCLRERVRVVVPRFLEVHSEWKKAEKKIGSVADLVHKVQDKCGMEWKCKNEGVWEILIECVNMVIAGSLNVCELFIELNRLQMDVYGCIYRNVYQGAQCVDCFCMGSLANWMGQDVGDGEIKLNFNYFGGGGSNGTNFMDCIDSGDLLDSFSVFVQAPKMSSLNKTLQPGHVCIFTLFFFFCSFFCVCFLFYFLLRLLFCSCLCVHACTWTCLCFVRAAVVELSVHV